MENLEKLKKKYQGEWLAFLPSEKKMKKERLKGRLLAHHLDRRTLHQRLREKKVRGAYITFAGPLVKPGYSIIL